MPLNVTTHLVLFIAAICGSFTFGESGNSAEDTTVPVTIHRRIRALPCELVQEGSIVIGKDFASVQIEGLAGEVYSPELGPHDFIAYPSEIPRSAAKLARKSGFELKKIPSAYTMLPQVVPLSRHVNCPELHDALTATEQERTNRRNQIQSKIYGLDTHGIVPLSPRGKREPKSDQPLTSQPDQDTRAGSRSRSPKIEGTVILRAVIGIDGRVQQVRVTRSLTPEIDKKAAEEVSRWEFFPARMKGLPIPMETIIEINFQLTR